MPKESRALAVNGRPDLELALLKERVRRLVKTNHVGFQGPVNMRAIIKQFRIIIKEDWELSEDYLGGSTYYKNRIMFIINPRFPLSIQNSVLAYLLFKIELEGPHHCLIPNDTISIYTNIDYLKSMTMASILLLSQAEYYPSLTIEQISTYYQVPEELALFWHKLHYSEEGITGYFHPTDYSTGDHFFEISKDPEEWYEL